MDSTETQECLDLIEDLQLHELGDRGRIEELYQILKHGGDISESDITYLTWLNISLQKIKNKQDKRIKPVVIITIAVVLAAIVSFGVYVGLDEYKAAVVRENIQNAQEFQKQYQMAIDKEIQKAYDCENKSGWGERLCKDDVRKDLYHTLIQFNSEDQYSTIINLYNEPFCWYSYDYTQSDCN